MRFHPLTTRSDWLSPLGLIHLSASPQGLSGIFFEDQKHLPNVLDWPKDESNPFIEKALEWLKAYFNKPASIHRLPWTTPLDFQSGTEFQQLVWQELLRIPMGKTLNYGELAQRIQRPQAVRAVGAAVGRNPLSLIVPCHRIVGASGHLTGYAGGLWRKEKLLQWEHLSLDSRTSTKSAHE